MSEHLAIALARAVQSIRATSGSAWDDFMAVLVARADHITDQLVLASSAEINRLQGHAREARALLKELAEAPKLLERFEEERKQNGNTQHR